MDVTALYKKLKKIKFFLVFFCFAGLTRCQNQHEIRMLQVDFENNKAVGVSFTSEMDVEKLRFFIGEESEISVVGVIVSVEDRHTFTPVIPFTAEQTYSIRMGDKKVLTSFTVDDVSKSNPPELIGIYPSKDSVPENLLKMYLQFSQPMEEVGNALDFVTGHNDTDDIPIEPFLKLETELWNEDHTILTLWFDPGRIKTDLIPNREKGLPLNSEKKYTITIDDRWRGANGKPLKSVYTKKLHVQNRDSYMPRAEDWKLTISGKDPEKPLIIEFGEPLDAFLALETIKVYDLNEMPVDGEYELHDGEEALKFIPAEIWSSNEYLVKIESRLEDLAGNNLNRLFDTTLKNASKNTSINVRSIRFKVR